MKQILLNEKPLVSIDLHTQKLRPRSGKLENWTRREENSADSRPICTRFRQVQGMGREDRSAKWQSSVDE
jgi:hypothetical protein